MTAVLPPARVAIAGNAPPSREWYRYFQASTQVNLDVGTLRHDVDALTVRVTALEDAPPSIGDIKITGTGSIYVSATAIKVVSLEGDAEGPGFTTYYGTDVTGAKGWYAVSDALASSGNIAKSTDAAGVTSFDLVDLADSGTGAALVKITRDAKGRVSGTSAATTTDLAEGDNLYFTDARVRATALTGLSTATATPVTATDSVLVGVGKLQGQASAAATAIAGKEPSITAGTAAQYWRGDKTWQTLNKGSVGLGNVDNTSDVNKPVSTAQAAAIATKLSKTGDTATGSYTFDSPTLAVDSVNHRVGMGTTTPARTVHVVGPDGPVASYPSSVIGTRNILVLENNNNCNIGVIANPSNNAGFFYVKSGASAFSGSLQYNFLNDSMGLYTVSFLRVLIDASGNTTPGADNTQTLGSSSLRWSVVYAGTGTINTSDAREKTLVAPLTTNELAAAADLARTIGTYQWLASIADKGADGARHHAGLTVQRAIEIMQAHGLDPMRYGFICYDQWDETPEVVNSWPAQDAVLDDDGNVITPAIEAGSEVTQAYRPAGDRYSFRHDELLLFIARGFAARLDALESA